MLLKKGLMVLAFSGLTLVSCSHMQGNIQEVKREAASVNDIGVVGIDRSVILYYKEGDYIIVKNCDRYTILGSTPTQARANCQGKFNQVPVESFKQALRNLVSADRLNVLKPLTPEEVEAYLKDGLNSTQMESMIIELDKINAFIATYGAESANLIRKEELLSALKSNETRVSAIKKINSEIEKGIAFITDQTTLTLKNFGTNKDQFLYTVLKNFDPTAKFPCGLTGSIDDRVKDCSRQESSVNGNFVLVTRTKEFKEVQKDTRSGILWGDRIPRAMDHYDAEKVCKADLAEVGGVSGTWRLPSSEEYKEANINGIRTALPNMRDYWWSSSVKLDRSGNYVAFRFDGNRGEVDDYLRSTYFSVRCVAKTRVSGKK